MAQVSNITIGHTTTRNPLYGRVNSRKQPDIPPVLENKSTKIRKKALDPSKNPAITGIAPRGYMMIEDFFAELEKRINDYCDAKGLP